MLNRSRMACGTAFLIEKGIAVTCAHVVSRAGSKPGDRLALRFVIDNGFGKALVLEEGWSPPGQDDTAFLQLESLSDGAGPLVLGAAEERHTHPFVSFGCAHPGDRKEHDVFGEIGHTIRLEKPGRRSRLRLECSGIIGGMSGAPILDTTTNLIVGMAVEFQRVTSFAWAVTSDTLANHWPALRLWPDWKVAQYALSQASAGELHQTLIGRAGVARQIATELASTDAGMKRFFEEINTLLLGNQEIVDKVHALTVERPAMTQTLTLLTQTETLKKETQTLESALRHALNTSDETNWRRTRHVLGQALLSLAGLLDHMGSDVRRAALE